jgi:hypothetical protein
MMTYDTDIRPTNYARLSDSEINRLIGERLDFSAAIKFTVVSEGGGMPITFDSEADASKWLADAKRRNPGGYIDHYVKRYLIWPSFSWDCNDADRMRRKLVDLDLIPRWLEELTQIVNGERSGRDHACLAALLSSGPRMQCEAALRALDAQGS